MRQQGSKRLRQSFWQFLLKRAEPQTVVVLSNGHTVRPHHRRKGFNKLIGSGHRRILIEDRAFVAVHSDIRRLPTVLLNGLLSGQFTE